MEASELRRISRTITLARNISLVTNCFVLLLICVALGVPHTLPPILKFWIAGVFLFAFALLSAAQYWAHEDPTVTILFTYLSSFVSGLGICGLSLLLIFKSVK